MNLRYAVGNLKNNFDVCLEAVKSDGMSLQFMDSINKSEHVIVLEAVKNKGKALEYAGTDL